ncbi:alpha/beta hydrolase [Massilia sp. CFBP9012]|uniref:alpha/beta fold hydrolase n=1 Tax=Massilia sp. CFBP9012 TaxID=3096531 RepID=UPI002A69E603|nr:alpha/beta hydrolase [Massilia sp. CFBP9012]MDY0975788.1 alpha/beta hydrolase [Massilia sp. CFBP9012]
MLLDVNGHQVYCYSGGKAFDPGLPAVVLIHGAQNDHSVWALQSRALAHRGYAVLAPDLPGHGRSSGPPLSTVEAMAAWVLALLDAAGASRALLAGHSMGSLIALEATHLAPQRVSGLALLGATYPMRVSDTLLEAARTEQDAAIEMVAAWSHASWLPGPSTAGPGASVINTAQRLMQRIAARGADSLFHTDFAACNAYANGEAAAASVACPTLFVQGKKDMMTPPRSAQLLTGGVKHARVVGVDAGHAMMSEAPDAVLDALLRFAADAREAGSKG